MDCSQSESEERTERLVDYIKILSNKSSDRDALQGVYKDWADKYDQDLTASGYTCPAITAQYVEKYVSEEARARMRVLDVGAGTGMVATELHSIGFKRIDALDPSEVMLDKAKSQNLYDDYICEFITGDKLKIPDETYDVITATGCFGDTHVKHDALYEMIRLTKPGGYIIITTRADYMETQEEVKYKLLPLLADLETKGTLTKVETAIVPNGYYFGLAAIVLMLQVV